MKPYLYKAAIWIMIFTLSLLNVNTGYCFYAGSLDKGLVGEWSLSKEDTTTGTTNLVTNGTFDTDTGWIKETANWTINVGTGTADCDGAQGQSRTIRQEISLVDGQRYTITYTISNRTAGNFRPVMGATGPGTFRNANGTYTETITASGDTILYLQADATFAGSIDNVTVYDVTGDVMDLTPQSNTGTRIGTTWTTDRKGQVDQALDFNGTSDYVLMGASPITGNTDFSMSAWIYNDNLQNGFGGFVVGTGVATRQGAYIGVAGGTVVTGLYGVNISTGISGLNTWRHVVLTHNSATGNMYAYVDGVYAGTSATGATNITGDIKFGRFTTGTPYYFAGKIQEAKLYDKVLSQTEITELYDSYNPQISAGSLSKGLVGEWSLSKEDSKAGADLNTEANAVSVTNEANATTGWAQTGLDEGANVFQSQGATTSNGSYAFEANANDTPTNGARFYEGLGAFCTLGKTYTIQYDARHVGSGGDWEVKIGANSIGFLSEYSNILTSSDVTWTTYSTTFEYSGQTAYFVMTESSGTNDGGVYLDKFIIKESTGIVLDKTPSSNNGTRVGTTWTTDRHGQANKALAFNGTSGYVDLSSSDFISDYAGDTKGSFSGWFKTSTNLGTIFSVSKGTDTTNYFQVITYLNKISFFIEGKISIESNSSLIDNTWHHIAITQDGTISKMYIDGVLQTDTDSGEWFADLSNLAYARIGTMQYNGNITNTFSGSLSDVRYYSGRALTQTEVTSLYDSYKPQIYFNSLNKGLVGHWALDKSNTTTGDDILLGWDFTSGWATNQTIVDSDTYSSSGAGGVYKDYGIKGGETYLFRYEGSSSSSAAWLNINNQSSANKIMLLNGLETVYTAPLGLPDYKVYLRNDDAGTTDVTKLEVYDVTGNVMDLTPSSNAGTRVGTTWTTDRKGQSNKALSFNGTTDYVDLSSSDFISDFGSDTKGSFSIWMNMATDSNIDVAFSASYGVDNTNSLYFYNSAGQIRFYLTAGSNLIRIDSDESLDYEKWHHIVITQDGTTSKMYVNGVLQTDTDSGEWLDDLTGLAYVTIGASQADSLYKYFWEGSIDDIRYYSGRALTQTEITRLYEQYQP